MPIFLQYNIDEINKDLIVFSRNFKYQKPYKNNEIEKIYLNNRSFETTKTRSGFLTLLKKIIFKPIETEKNSFLMTEFGFLIKNFDDNQKLLNEIIYSYLFENTDIFRIECKILYEILLQKGIIIKNKDNFELLLLKKLKNRINNEKKELKNSFNNAKNKIKRTIKNLSILGCLSEEDNKIHLKFYRPEKIIIFLEILQEFRKKKIDFDNLLKAKFISKYFMEPYDMNYYIEEFDKLNWINYENRSGLNQIHLNFSKSQDFINKIFN